VSVEPPARWVLFPGVALLIFGVGSDITAVGLAIAGFVEGIAPPLEQRNFSAARQRR